MLINAGLQYVYYAEGYGDEMAEAMARDAGVQLIRLSEEESLP